MSIPTKILILIKVFSSFYTIILNIYLAVDL